MREVFATEADVMRDPKWLSLLCIHGYHYYTANDPSRQSVESENIKASFDLATHLGGQTNCAYKSLTYARK